MELQGELNRLAGTSNLEAAGAANVWAGTTGLELIGALNVKAGTSGVGLNAAVRATLGSSTGEAQGQLQSARNVIRLPGTAGNYVSTPDSVAVSLTADADIRVKTTLDNWANGASQSLVAKYNVTGNQRSYFFFIGASGNLNFQWSADGTNFLLATSSGVLGLANGATKWTRVTFDADNGASGRTVTFYTSDDGVTWLTFGTAQTSAGVTSIFDSTTLLEVGARNGGTADLIAGIVHYAEIRSSIGGAIIATFDPAVLGVRGVRVPSSWTGSQGNTWTINGSGWSWTARVA